MRALRLASFVIPVTVIIAIVTRDAYLLFSVSIPVGTDGFYYVNQVEAIRSTGTLCYPSPTPLLLYLFGLLSGSPACTIVVIKAGAIFLLCIVLAGAWRFIAHLTGESIAGVTTAAVIVASNNHLYFVAEFINNLAALALLVWAAAFLLQADIPGGASIAAVLIACAAVTHSSVTVIVPGALAVVPVSIALTRMGRFRTFAAIGVCVTIVSIGFLWSSTGNRKVASLFQGDTGLEMILLAVAVGIQLASLWFAAGSVRSRAFLHREFTLASIITALAFTLNPILDRAAGLESIGGRTSLLAHIQLSAVIPVLVYTSCLNRVLKASVCLGLVTGFVVLNLTRPIPAGLTPSVLARRSELLKVLKDAAGAVSADATVIAAHGDQFLVTHALRLRSVNRRPSDAVKAKVFWLVRGRRSTLDALRESAEPRAPDSGYALIEDSKLRTLLDMLSERGRVAIAAANPHIRKELYPALDSEWDKMRYR